MSFFSRILSLLASLSVILGSFVARPVPSPTPIESPLLSVGIEAAATELPVVVSATPAPSPVSQKDVEDAIAQVVQLKQDIQNATPEPTPTPQVVYVPQVVMATPAPTPTPQAAPAKVISVDFAHNAIAQNPTDGIVVIKTDNPARLMFSYIVDDGSIMAAYASGSKDNDRLSAVVAQYALTHAVQTDQTELGTLHIIRVADLVPGHLWFSITAENATGQSVAYLHNGNIWDWNSNLSLTVGQ